jgi:hypothetical protein
MVGASEDGVGVLYFFSSFLPTFDEPFEILSWKYLLYILYKSLEVNS